MCDHSPNREAAMVTLERDANGKATVWCDPCIAPLVKALNDGGIRTDASCCGHGRDVGLIMLTDGRELFILPDWLTARKLNRYSSFAKLANDPGFDGVPDPEDAE